MGVAPPFLSPSCSRSRGRAHGTLSVLSCVRLFVVQLPFYQVGLLHLSPSISIVITTLALIMSYVVNTGRSDQIRGDWRKAKEGLLTAPLRVAWSAARQRQQGGNSIDASGHDW